MGRSANCNLIVAITIVTIAVTSFKLTTIKKTLDNKKIAIVRKTLDSLYNAFSFKAASEPDWLAIKHLALKGAAFVSAPQPGHQRAAVNIAEFINDYKSDIAKSGLAKTGYSEHILTADIQIIKNVAVATVVFKAFISGDKRLRKPGMDNVQLLFDEGRWKIVAFTTQAESDIE